MRWKAVLVGLVAVALPILLAGCARTVELPRDPDRQEKAAEPDRTIAYRGPENPGDSEWVLRSLNGRDAVGDEDMVVLFATNGEFGGEGGCMGFSIYHKLEGDRMRIVDPGFQTGSYDCGKPDELERQANDVLDIARDLARLEISDDRLKLSSEGDKVAVFAHPPPAEVDPALVGTEWFLVSLEGKKPLAGAPKLTLEIGRDTIRGFSGCNMFGGTVDTMVGGYLVYAIGYNEGLESTLVGCSGKVLTQERAYQDAVAGADGYRLDDGRLELIDGRGLTTAVFEEKAQWTSNPDDLVGTRWMVRSIDGEQPVKDSVPTVHFRSEKRISWYDGCQNFEGQYSASDNDLAVPGYGVVGGDCMKPGPYLDPGEPPADDLFVPTGDYRLAEGMLEIRSETGETIVILEPIDRGDEPVQRATAWELEAFEEDGERTPVRGTEITLAFDRGTLREAGTIFGSTGCNNYRAPYKYPRMRNTLERIEVFEPVTTRRACIGPPYLAEQEERFLAVLGDLGEYPNLSVNGEMTLETGDGRKLIFTTPE